MDRRMEERLIQWAQDGGRDASAATYQLARTWRANSTFTELARDVLIPTMQAFGELLRSEGFDYEIREGHDAMQARYVRFHLMISSDRRSPDRAPSLSFTEQAETATTLATITSQLSLSSVQEVAMSDLDRSQVIQHLMTFARDVLSS